MDLKETVRSALPRDSKLYQTIRTIYRYRSPASLRRAVSMRIRRDSRFDSSELEMASLCPTEILDEVLSQYAPTSWLDVGCGTGQAMLYLLAKGIDCVGLEGSTAAIEESVVGDRIQCVNLNDPVSLGREFDLVWCYEVAEHIHPKFVNALLDTLTGHGNVLVMSAAKPGQGGRGHFNEQPPEYWIEKLESRDFLLETEFTESLHALNVDFSANMLAFRHLPDGRVG
ncbi:MAG: methyltransferase domain-containing protein [Acidimicrobiia bacterium]